MSAGGIPIAGSPAPLTEKAAEALVHRIARTHFGHRPKRLRRLGGGLTNAVFAFKIDHQGIVVRVNADATKIQDFQKEHWAMDRAHEAGVRPRRCSRSPTIRMGRLT